MAEAAVPITSEPKLDQLVEYEGRTYRTVKEGLAYILIPPNAKLQQDPSGKAKTSARSSPKTTSKVVSSDARTTAQYTKAENPQTVQNVFYNPIQQFNRDLSVLAIKAFGEDFCRRQSSRREQQKHKNDGRKDRRRDRKAAHSKRQREEGDEEGAFTKWRKLQNGARLSPEDGTDQLGDASHEDAGERGDREHVQGPGSDEGIANEPAQSSQPWTPRFRILDALSATGLRALRYAQEIPFATAIVANDMDRGATKSIAANIMHNKVDSKVTTNLCNAIGHMYNVAFPPHDSHGPSHVSGKYDVIDLDPYGTAVPFLDAALHAINDGGLLCVTCTDSGVFASTGYSEKTFSLYGGMPAKAAHSHETGLRLIIHSIATAAAKIGIGIEPLLSLSIDFYARVFVRVRKSPADVKFLAGKTMLVFECDVGCGAWTTQHLGRHVKQRGKNDTAFFKFPIGLGPRADQHCEHCGSKTHIAGPMWAGPLHNAAFVEKILHDIAGADKSVYGTIPRIEGMLDTALDELSVNDRALETTLPDEDIPRVPSEAIDHSPFFFIPSVMSKVLHCQAPPEAAVKGALRHAGYRVARSHCKPGSIKTDAPWTALWQIMREWVSQKAPLRDGALHQGQPGWQIMQAGQTVESPASRVAENTDSETSSPDVVVDAKVDFDAAVREKPKDPKTMKVIFDEALGRDKPGRRLVRYQANPRENWGPMSRAKGSG